MDEARKLIIYFEDDPEMITLVNFILNPRGYDVKGMMSGNEAIRMVGELKPALILLDLMMPDMDGWDVCKKLKQNDATANIPIIIVTAKSQPIDRMLGLQFAMVSDYIVKPFHPQELVDSVQSVLAK